VAGSGVCACKCKLKSIVSFNKKVFACSRTEALKERTGKRSSSMRGLCTGMGIHRRHMEPCNEFTGLH
jgi:hypothetical protein